LVVRREEGGVSDKVVEGFLDPSGRGKGNWAAEVPATAAGRARSRRPYTAQIGSDALVMRADGSSINFGDAIYHPENAEEARAYAIEAEAAPGLDVERLLDAAHNVAEADPDLLHWDVDQQWWELPQGPHPYLKATAAEYARLAAPEAAEGEGT
jgi:hypothetical protein